MDDFVKVTLRKRTASNDLHVETTIKKSQNKTRDIYGALANMRQYLQGLNAAQDKTSRCRYGTYTLVYPTNNLTILLLGQPLNTVIYNRR